MKTPDELIESYDKLASEYAVRFCDELEGKPFDRNLLQRFADAIPGGPAMSGFQRVIHAHVHAIRRGQNDRPPGSRGQHLEIGRGTGIENNILNWQPREIGHQQAAAGVQYVQIFHDA